MNSAMGKLRNFFTSPKRKPGDRVAAAEPESPHVPASCLLFYPEGGEAQGNSQDALKSSDCINDSSPAGA